MGLNAKKEPSNKDKGFKQKELAAGSYPCRLVQLLDLGLQPQRPYKGKPKPNCHQVRLTYELLDEFSFDEEGKELLDKPRWLSERIPFNNLDLDLAASTKRYYALDPEDTCDGEFKELVGLAANLIVTTKPGTGKNAANIYNNVGGLTAMRPKEVEKQPELVNPPKVFLLDEPDLEVLGSLPEWVQDLIKSNLEYKGSILCKALEGEPQEGSDEPADKTEGDWV